MQTFKDMKGRAWNVEVGVREMKRVRERLGVKLGTLIGDGLRPLGELVGNPEKLCDVLFVLIEDQAKALKVSDEDFGRAMGGDSIAQAAEAFVAALLDFFPRKQREALAELLAKSRKLADLLTEDALSRLGEMDPEKEAARLIAEAEKRRKATKEAKEEAPTAASGREAAPAPATSPDEPQPSVA